MLLSINSKIIDKPILKNSHGSLFESLDLNADEFIARIQLGHAYSAQYLDGKRKSQNFHCTGFLAIDVDQGLTINEACKLPFIMEFASFIHTTSSHTSENNRFRIVFELSESITDPVLHRAAMAGLVTKFGGDKSTTDSARMFYGNTKAEIFRFGKVLPVEQVQAAVAISLQGNERSEGMQARRAPAISVRLPFGEDHLVRRPNGKMVPLSSVTEDDRSIHCPFHLDAHPSAFVVRSKSGSIGVHCHSCCTTSWTSTPSLQADFDWHRHYEMAAEHHVWGVPFDEPLQNPIPHISNDGTNVWLTSDRFLSEIQVEPGITFMRSPKGSGKTQQLASIVEKLKKDGKKILLVGHRRLLLNNLAKRLNIASYLKRRIADGVDDDGCLAVSLESLPHYVNPREDKFDAIIIDESEQVVSHFISKTMAKVRMASRATLEHYLKRAEYVICSDADIGLLTSGLMYLMLCKEHPDHLHINQYRREEERAKGKLNEISIYEDEGRLLDELVQDVKSGFRCFVATNSKRRADRIEALIKKISPDKEILLVTSATSALTKIKRFIKHPATESMQYDVVICSPALSTGVDITFPGEAQEFQGVYGFFNGNITTHFDIDQQISRVRHPGKIGIWIGHQKMYAETDPVAIQMELRQSRDMAEHIVGFTETGDRKFADDAIIELFAWILSLRRTSLLDLKSLYVSLRRSNGWKVTDIAGTGSSILPTYAADHEFVDLVCSAKDLKREDYESLKVTLKSSLGVTSERLARARRYEIKRHYQVNEVTRDLVVLDDEGRFRESFAMLRLLYQSEQDSSEPGTIRRDRNEIQFGNRSSVDWENLTLKKRLLIEVIASSGLYEEQGIFSFRHAVTKENLSEFIGTVTRRRDDLLKLFDLTVRSDLARAPVIQLREILKLVGLTLTKKSRTRKGGVVTDGYLLDQQRWIHVVDTCRLDSRFIDHQILRESFVLDSVV